MSSLTKFFFIVLSITLLHALEKNIVVASKQEVTDIDLKVLLQSKNTNKYWLQVELLNKMQKSLTLNPIVLPWVEENIRIEAIRVDNGKKLSRSRLFSSVPVFKITINPEEKQSGQIPLNLFVDLEKVVKETDITFHWSYQLKPYVRSDTFQASEIFCGQFVISKQSEIINLQETEQSITLPVQKGDNCK